jgi:autotransporter passenger strand-loop-strand repeat protein
VAGGGTVASGASLAISSGVTLQDTAVSGGVIDLAMGAMTLGDLSFVGSGGTMIVEGITAPEATISGWNYTKSR